MAIKSFRDLAIWQQARTLAKNIYELSESFPDREKYGLTAQLRRAAISVPSNIAEGHIRNSTKEFLYFLNVALGSLAEIETQVLLAVDFGYTKEPDVTALLELIHREGRMIRSLQKKLSPIPNPQLLAPA